MRLSCDMHVHSHHSGDSDAPMLPEIERAIRLGLKTLCFTEHQDFDYPESLEPAGTFDLQVNAYRAELDEMRARFGDRIRLPLGVELGLQRISDEKNRAFVQAHPFDFVIGSVHLDDGIDPYFPSFFDRAGYRTPREAMLRHLEVTLENLQGFDDFDVLGHLDQVNRYFPEGEVLYDTKPFAELAEAILQRLVKKDKGLDCNTKLLFSRSVTEMNPHREWLKLFYRLGGRILTFGSDAHRAEDIGKGLEEGAEIARQCGFTEYCTFEGRIPVFHPL